jgi:enamine deaminase RidA (YjgF/YER057c/UK114 family)
VVGDTVSAQLAQAVKNVATALEAAGSGLPALARLNVYVTEDAHVHTVRSGLKAALGPGSHPAVTAVVTPLPVDGALVALDAIAAVADDRAPDTVQRIAVPALAAQNRIAPVSVLPKGRTLYISGMAESTDDLAVATVGTMKQLHTVLALNKLQPEHVVHLKAFLKPMNQTDTVQKVMAAYYPEKPAPSMTFVEWRNGLPIEIELIAHLPGAPESETGVELRWQPEEKRSPVYCRFAIVNSPTRIYTQGYLAAEASDAAAQIHSIYDQLRATIAPLGSDFEHLVKATYYHSASDTSQALNEIRPELYNPERPPAASKAHIFGTGDEARSMLVDMIAVPR